MEQHGDDASMDDDESAALTLRRSLLLPTLSLTSLQSSQGSEWVMDTKELMSLKSAELTDSELDADNAEDADDGLDVTAQGLEAQADREDGRDGEICDDDLEQNERTIADDNHNQDDGRTDDCNERAAEAKSGNDVGHGLIEEKNSDIKGHENEDDTERAQEKEIRAGAQDVVADAGEPEDVDSTRDHALTSESKQTSEENAVHQRSVSAKHDEDDEDDLDALCASPRDHRELDDMVDLQYSLASPGQNDQDITVESSATNAPIATSTDSCRLRPTRVADCTDVVAQPEPIKGMTAPVAPQPAYSVQRLFPVRYENKQQPKESPQSAPTAIAPVAPPPAPSTTSEPKTGRAKSGNRKPRALVQVEVGAVKTLRQAQSQLQTLQEELENTKVAQRSQREMHEREVSILKQRIRRQRTQIEALTAEAQRAVRQNAQLRTENELYAAKMPQLQAELHHETSHGDATHAHATQMQLELTQLRAKVQVLQTRNSTLDTQLQKNQTELRSCKKESERRATTAQQHTDKLRKVEQELTECKLIHAQDVLTWKTRMASTLQRIEIEKRKVDDKFKKDTEFRLGELRAVVAKESKRRRDAEARITTLEQQLQDHQRQLEAQQSEMHRSAKESKSIELLLRRAHQTEARLKSQLAGVKARLVLADEQRRGHSAAWHYATCRCELLWRQKRNQFPLELLDQSDEQDLHDGPESTKSGIEVRICSLCEEMKSQSTLQAERLAVLEAELEKARADINRLRAVHSRELQAQVEAFRRLIPQPSIRSAATA